MNLYGLATGTNAYSLNIPQRENLCPGDIVTVAFLNENTGASTLSINGRTGIPLLRNESAMASGDLVALTFYQFCYTGAALIQDAVAAAGATTDASLLTSGTLAAARLPTNINAANLADGSVSNTELQYINSLSSNAQSQLDALVASIASEAATRAAADSGLTSSLAGKASTSHTHSGADITTGTVPVAAIPTAIPANSIANGTVDNTEFQTLNGVTSNIQNQLDNKLGLPGGTTSQILLGNGAPSSTLPFSATDNTKVPLAGTSSLTGPLGWSSNSGNGTSSAVWLGKDANGYIANVGSGGSGGALQVFASNTLKAALNETYGLLFYGDFTPSAGGAQICRDSSSNLRYGVVSGATHRFDVNGSRVGGFPLTPSDMPAGATSAGTQHLGDGTWRNQYSLAAGTHNGLIILADDQGKVALFSLVGTTVTLYANVAGSAWLDTADATHGQLRCSGGYLQVILGVSMANRYVTTFFIGNVR